MIRNPLPSAMGAAASAAWAALQFLRDHFVHLTVVLVIATAWVLAWRRSLTDLPRLLAPPITPEEVRQARQSYRRMAAEDDRQARLNSTDDDDER
jgi:hypothetical protein